MNKFHWEMVICIFTASHIFMPVDSLGSCETHQSGCLSTSWNPVRMNWIRIFNLFRRMQRVKRPNHYYKIVTKTNVCTSAWDVNLRKWCLSPTVFDMIMRINWVDVNRRRFKRWPNDAWSKSCKRSVLSLTNVFRSLRILESHRDSKKVQISKCYFLIYFSQFSVEFSGCVFSTFEVVALCWARRHWMVWILKSF